MTQHLSTRNVAFAAAALLFAALVMLGTPSSSPAADAGKDGAKAPASQPSGPVTIQGDCEFGGTKGTINADLKPNDKGGYDVVYNVVWGKQKSTWKGTMKGDFSGDFSGMGGSGNGTFKFEGKFVNGVLKAKAPEVGGRGRVGSITLKAPTA
jgi:hypothetical protein